MAQCQAYVQISADYKLFAEVGAHNPATGFSQVVNSGDFAVTEPVDKHNLYVVRVNIPLDSSVMAQSNWANIIIKRIAPTGVNYNEDIYLSALTFNYAKLSPDLT